MQRYDPKVSEDDCILHSQIIELAKRFGRYGYRRITAMLRRNGWVVNHKGVQRFWREEGLRVLAIHPKRGRQWFANGYRIRKCPEYRNHVWSYDFVMDRTHDGKRIWMLAVIDEYTRECLAIKVARSLNSQSVASVLFRLFLTKGLPDHIRSDNGPEFTSRFIKGKTFCWGRDYSGQLGDSGVNTNQSIPVAVDSSNLAI